MRLSHSKLLSAAAAAFVVTGSMISMGSAQDDKEPASSNAASPAKEGGDDKGPTEEELRKSIKKISDHEFQLGVLKLDSADKSLRVPATMRIVKGPLEYLLVNEKGSAHESLFMTAATPFEVNVAMLLLGYKECSDYFKKASPESLPKAVKHPKVAPESNFEVLVEWKNDKGELATTKAEEWVFNLAANAKLTDGPFVYTGSFINDQGQLSAQANGNVIALYNEPGALAQNPRKYNDLDDVWESRPALAVEGREVALILRRSAAAAAPAATAKGESDSLNKSSDAESKKLNSKSPQKPTTKSKP